MFSTNLLYVGLPRKAFPGKQAKVDTGHQCFSVVTQATPQDSPKASPMAIFKWKNLIGQLNPLLEWMLNESWRRLSLLSLTCQLFFHIAVWQLCREGQPLWKSHDGLNLTCLDQCHGVRFHGTNCQTVYSLNLILSLHLHTFTSVFSTNLLYVGLPRKAFPGKQAKVDTGHQCFSVVAQATPQDSPKASPMAIFKWKNLIGQLNPLLEWMLNESWRRPSLLSSTCQHVATLQFDSCAEKDSLRGRVMMAWI